MTFVFFVSPTELMHKCFFFFFYDLRFLLFERVYIYTTCAFFFLFFFIAFLMLSKLFSICIFMMVVTMVTAVNHNRVCQEDKLKRPRQFRMQVYSKPNQKGAVQTMRVTNGCKYYFRIGINRKRFI